MACHDILDVRSADVPYSRDDRALRARVRALNESVKNSCTVEVAEAVRCETMPALLLVGYEPHPGSESTFATAVRSLVALRHVEPPKAWNEAAKMGSIAGRRARSANGEGSLVSGGGNSGCSELSLRRKRRRRVSRQIRQYAPPASSAY